MQRHHPVILGLLGLIIVASSGCAPTQLGANYGTAYYTMKEDQILNPTADQNHDPVTEMDGVAAATAMTQYRKSFEKPEEGFGKSLITSGVQTK